MISDRVRIYFLKGTEKEHYRKSCRVTHFGMRSVAVCSGMSVPQQHHCSVVHALTLALMRGTWLRPVMTVQRTWTLCRAARELELDDGA